MLRRTKIVATLGPASSEQKVLEEMIRAGVDVVRMNFSHGSAQDHMGRAERVRAAEKIREDIEALRRREPAARPTPVIPNPAGQ